MSSTDKSLYIQVLEYGNQHPEGFTFQQLKDQLTLTDEQANLVRIEYEEYSQFFTSTSSGLLRDKKLFLSATAQSQLLDYYELKEARKSSQQAQKSSKYATWIAIGSLIISIIIGLVQIFSIQDVNIVHNSIKGYGYGN